MIKTDTLVLFQEDIHPSYDKLPFSEIDYHHFKIEKKKINRESLIIFIGDGGKTKILKSRWGDRGTIVNRHDIDNIITELNRLRDGIQNHTR